MSLEFSYAGMNAGVLGAWILVGLAAGNLARLALGGPKPLGLFGDMLVGLFGAFGLGAVLRLAGVDLTAHILQLAPTLTSATAVWVDVVLTAFLGALVIRIALRALARS